MVLWLEIMINKNIYLVLFFLLPLLACGERHYKGEDQNISKQVDQNLNYEKTPKPSKSDNSEIRGKVIKIADGDTFTLIFENNFEVRVRLNGIDCPEKKQAFSNKAKQALSDLIFGKMVIEYMRIKMVMVVYWERCLSVM